MLNHSLRRVARTCSTNSSPLPTRPSTPAAASFTSYAHQRRHSSSKPPVPPNNGSPTIPAAVKQVGAPASDSKRSTADSRVSRRKIQKDKSDSKNDSQYYNWTSTLPSVPNLQHLNPKDIYVAAFFGTHRPISISGPVTPEASMEAIDKMFQPKPKRSRSTSQDVIYTLSSAVENLDEQISNKRAAQSAEHKANIIKALISGNANLDQSQTQHLDGAPQAINLQGGNVKIALQEFAKRFRPYNVPPAPVPLDESENASADAEDAANEEMQAQTLEIEIQQQDFDPYIQQVVLNVPKNPQLQTGDFFTSHEARLVDMENPMESYEIGNPGHNHEIQDPTSQPSMGRRRGPGLYRVPNRSRTPTIMAISVKRQRRLKMKKHKFKKLTRRVRNLKMRQGKI